MTNFKELNLLPSILSELTKKGYTTPTPIQGESIPHLLQGSDLLGIAQTGTGKTAAFSLPIIHRLSKKKIELRDKQVRALILTPTRELATQIDSHIKLYANTLDILSEVVIGGVRKELQIKALENGADIVIATPGRLMDLMRGKHVDLSSLEIFVLDEADMMLDMGFLQDVETISQDLPSVKQTVLFSATMPKIIEDLAKKLLKNPKKVEVTPESSTLEKISQEVFFVLEDDKLSLLTRVLEDTDISKVLVFCKAKYGVANVVEHLVRSEVSVGEIHSNKSQIEREAALKEFSEGKMRVLVATDIAARGIDVSKVSHVINFNMPEDATNYVHRIGRTARAGRSGKAISLCGEKDLPLLRNVEKLIKLTIPRVIDQPFHQEFVVKPKRKEWAKKKRKR
ncbi:DEAD/DEAH box helicase [Halobacteriovorax marinus]|uniref:DEAD/DEAH box helicase n=1 Tax=Halobacteriovorax marinus TaxID=97084 RepID=A0A1Y5F775_9BACT|nr:DEAD/DEAH box helicase [Halobacteriovorax marinus]